MAAPAEEPAMLMGEAALAKLPKHVVVSGDMPSEMAKVVIERAAEGLVNFKVEKDQAMHCKKALEAYNGQLWHVVIGTAFGASVAHEANCLLLLRFGKVYVLAAQSFDETSLTGGTKRVAKAAQKKEEDEEPASSAAE